MARIYIETTVVSFYFNARPEPETIARQNWTRRWLDAALTSSDDLVNGILGLGNPALVTPLELLNEENSDG